MPKHDVFISYSSKDEAKVLPVYQALQAAGVKCWISKYDIPFGGSHQNYTFPAVEDCQILLVFVSPNSDESPWVVDEVELAIGSRKTVVPIVIEKTTLVKLKYFLRNKNHYLALENEIQSYIPDIIHGIKTILPDTSSGNNIQPINNEGEPNGTNPPPLPPIAPPQPTLQSIFDAMGPKKNLVLNAVRAGATDVESADRSGRTALHYAVTNFDSNPDVVDLLLERGANVNARDKNGVTPLHLAVADVDLSRLLILKGADFEARDKTDQTPLSYAFKLKPVLVTQTKNLLQLHAEIKRGDKTPNDALQEAMAMKVKQSDRILDAIAAGADDVQMSDTFGRTALHWAAQENEPELVQLLLERGADINALESKGNTPEQLAHIKSATKAIEILRAWEHSHPVDQRKPKVVDEPRPPSKTNEVREGKAAFTYDVFLSYSSKNELFADNVFNALKASGLRVWMDRESIPGGAKWEQHITEALDNSRMMLVIVSQASMASKWVGREILVADELDKRILPVKIEEPGTRIPLCLREVQELNLVGNQSRSMVNRIVSATEEMLSSLEPDQAPPDEFVTEAPLPATVANERLQKVLQSKGRWKAEAIMRAIQNGATDFSFTDQRGRTALHWAAKEGNVDAMKIALDNGADVNALSEDGVTPLGWAKASIETGGVLAVVTQVLKKHGASG